MLKWMQDGENYKKIGDIWLITPENINEITKDINVQNDMEENEKMNKPNGYEKAASNAPKEIIRLGGHKAKIVEVEERQNKNGGDMLVVKFDFHSDDDQANYFVGLKSADSDKWPNGGTVYINVNAWDNPDETSKQFKGFCTAFSDSNNCEVPWGTDFAKSMKGKKIGVVFGEEESIWKDELFIGRKCRWFCDFAKAAD